MKKLWGKIKSTIAMYCVVFAMKLDFDTFTELAITCTAKIMHSRGAVRMEIKSVEEDEVKVRFVVPVGDEAPHPKSASDWVDEWKSQADGTPTIH